MSQSTAQDHYPTSVYRYYDSLGCLIYVGITRQGIGRNFQHNMKAEWWPYVVRQEVEHHPTRLAAARREKELIHEFRPPFNKAHNEMWQHHRAAYLAVRMSLPSNPTWSDCWKFLDRRLPLLMMNRDDVAVEFVSDPSAAIIAQTVSCVGNNRVQVVAQEGAVVGRVRRMEVRGTHLWISAQLRKEIEIEPRAHGFLLMKPLQKGDKCSIKSVRVVLK
jgi:hypothetical protein